MIRTTRCSLVTGLDLSPWATIHPEAYWLETTMLFFLGFEGWQFYFVVLTIFSWTYSQVSAGPQPPDGSVAWLDTQNGSPSWLAFDADWWLGVHLVVWVRVPTCGLSWSMGFSRCGGWVCRGIVPRVMSQEVGDRSSRPVRAGIASLLLCPVGQNHHRFYPDSMGWRDKLCLLMRKRQSHVAEKSGGWAILLSYLWTIQLVIVTSS